MLNIDEKFKDAHPADTVKKIQDILKGVGIEVFESWHDSGMENCFSLTTTANHGVPLSNGKGVTKELARASAYAEFIERLQSGLFLYKFQSIERDKTLSIHSYAPDAKYMTTEELVENGEWMDYVIDTYPEAKLNRKSLANLCKTYDCSNSDTVLTVPFYSLFEKKYVYLPMGFVDQIFATNGCCAGNTKEEAWVHGLSEMMERYSASKMLMTGKSAPTIPDEVLNKYPVVSKILNDIRQNGNFDIEVFDYSIGNKLPIVSTRIIDKSTQKYLVNVAADPVFEIALQRTLTELFQGKNLKNFVAKKSGTILTKVTDFSTVSNVMNQLETGNGLFTIDYFANEITCNKTAVEFSDNSDKNNKELLEYMLNLYRDLGKPVYVRNFSYLGFPSYRFVVPGFSEALAVKLSEKIPEHAVADSINQTLKNPLSANNADLNMVLMYYKMIKNVISRYNSYGRVSGVPLSSGINLLLACTTRAYCAYKLGNFNDAIKYMDSYIAGCSDEKLRMYFVCVNKYLLFKTQNINEDKTKSVMSKFFDSSTFERLYKNLQSGTPYDEFLLQCDTENCDKCQYKDNCSYQGLKVMYASIGDIYRNYIHGQDESEFAI